MPAHHTKTRTNWRIIILLALILGILPLALVSLLVGSRYIDAPTVFAALRHYDPSNDQHLIIHQLRIPRTILAIVTGMALGLAGVFMQSLTRNTLAEPGTLGVNAGAAAGVVVSLYFFSHGERPGIETYVWFAFLGAALAALLVHRIGRAQDAGVNPVRLVLAGAGISIVLGSLSNLLILAGPSRVFDNMRSWATGSLDGRGWEYVNVPTITLIIGIILAIFLAQPLNSVALGRDLAAALGVQIGRTWFLANLAIIILAGGATAAIGPIGFVGLAAPHIARSIVGTDHRWLLPYSALIAAYVLTIADILGRILAHPTEIGAGIMTAFIGAPFFIWLVKKGKVQDL